MRPIEDAPAGPRGYGRLLLERRFLAYFSSTSVGSAGYAVYAVAIPWIAYQVGGPLAVGLALFLEFTIFSLSFLTGPILDRAADLRAGLVASYVLLAVFSFLFGLLADEHRLDLPLLLALIAALSLVWDFAWTATNVALPRLVRTEEILRANGLLGAAGGLVEFGAYASGAALLLLAGAGADMLLYGALNGAAAIGALWITAPRRGAIRPGLAAAFREGWAFLAEGAGRPRLQIAGVSAVQAFASLAPILLLTTLAARSGAPAAYGLAYTAFAVGGILGNLLLGQLAPRARLGRWLAAFAVGEGALLLVATVLFPIGGLGIVPWIGVGAADGSYYALIFSYFQATSPPDLVGRAVSNAYVFRGLARAAGGLALAALLAAVAPEPGAVVAAAVFAAAAIGATALPGLRRMAL